MASRRTTTVAPTPPETAPPPAAPPAGPRRPRSRAERFAPYVFVAPLLAVFAVFYLWPALVTVLSSFFRWGLLRPWSPVEPDRWRFVGLDNYATTLTDPSFWNAVLNTAIWLVVFPVLVVAFSLLVSILIWHTTRTRARRAAQGGPQGNQGVGALQRGQEEVSTGCPSRAQYSKPPSISLTGRPS